MRYKSKVMVQKCPHCRERLQPLNHAALACISLQGDTTAEDCYDEMSPIKERSLIARTGESSVAASTHSHFPLLIRRDSRDVPLFTVKKMLSYQLTDTLTA